MNSGLIGGGRNLTEQSYLRTWDKISSEASLSDTNVIGILHSALHFSLHVRGDELSDR